MSVAEVKTLDQRRAQHAWQAIENLKKNYKKNDQETYAREAKKLPMRIMSAGLGQAMAFIRAKASDKPSLIQLHQDLTDWVFQGRKLSGKAPKSLLESIVRGNAVFLRRATDEVLAYLEWLNRFAEAEIEVDITKE